jgi:aldose 1-epimerase
MYQVKAKPFGQFKKYHIFNAVTGHEMVLTPEFGATILQVRLKGKDLLDPYPDSESLEKLSWARNSILIPYPNRIRDGIYQWMGKTYQFPINNRATANSIHGFLRNMRSTVEGIDLADDYAQVVCSFAYDGHLDAYPWPFSATISYTLSEESGFEVEMMVENAGASEIPMGLGWHPYFTLNDNADEWNLVVPPSEKVEVDKKMIPTGNRSRFDWNGKIEDLQVDTCFFWPGNDILEIKLSDNENTLHYWQDGESWPFFQLFIPPGRHCLAIEPMSCNVDAFNNKDHLNILKPGATFKGKFGFSLEKNS